MTLNAAIQALLSAYGDKKAGDRITPELHEAMFVMDNAFDRAVLDGRSPLRLMVRIRPMISTFRVRPFYHTISPELHDAVGKLKSHST